MYVFSFSDAFAFVMGVGEYYSIMVMVYKISCILLSYTYIICHCCEAIEKEKENNRFLQWFIAFVNIFKKKKNEKCEHTHKWWKVFCVQSTPFFIQVRVGFGWCHDAFLLYGVRVRVCDMYVLLFITCTYFVRGICTFIPLHSIFVLDDLANCTTIFDFLSAIKQWNCLNCKCVSNGPKMTTHRN